MSIQSWCNILWEYRTTFPMKTSVPSAGKAKRYSRIIPQNVGRLSFTKAEYLHIGVALAAKSVGFIVYFSTQISQSGGTSSLLLFNEICPRSGFKTERKRQGRFVRRTEKRVCPTKLTQHRGPIHPQWSVPASADEAKQVGSGWPTDCGCDSVFPWFRGGS